jgi:ribonuclease T2
MNTYWKNDPNDGTDEELWEHEWATHGTCISTLNPSCYTNYQSKEEAADFFKTVVNLFETLPTYTVSNRGSLSDFEGLYLLYLPTVAFRSRNCSIEYCNIHINPN